MDAADNTHDRIQENIARLMAETQRLNQPMPWYVPVLLFTGSTGLMIIAILIDRYLLGACHC